MYFRQIEDPYLAQYAYLIGCQRTGQALVIDPERDIDVYLNIAAENGLTIVAAAETHIHADFVSGTRELARRIPITAYLSREGGADWQYEWKPALPSRVRLIQHGDSFRIGHIEVQAVHTPGHTPEHLCYLVTDHGGGADEPMGMVSGDFVFVGDVGRPDLLESAAGVVGAKEPSARALYRSLMDFMTLPDYLQVWPGHGAGSACGKALGAIPDSTVGYERRFNPSLRAAQSGEERFVREILHGQPEPPLYFAQMKRWNKQGPPLLPESFLLERFLPERLPTFADHAETVVIDTREGAQFRAAHVPGSVWLPLSKSFASYAGSLIRAEQSIVLLCHEAQADLAVRLLWRVGLDNILGFVALSDYHAWSGGTVLDAMNTFTFAQALASDGLIVDVRAEIEYDEGHLPDAVSLPYARILTRLDELPNERLLVFYCSGGSRSAATASVLARLGYRVAMIDEPLEAAARLLVSEHAAS
ncbi:MAG: MBL fold metallo-hydrolase [bacterium]|nr:MBL fold metallo-hydrolase [bacterium]